MVGAIISRPTVPTTTRSQPVTKVPKWERKIRLRRLTLLSFCLYTQECTPVALGRDRIGHALLKPRADTPKGKREPH